MSALDRTQYAAMDSQTLRGRLDRARERQQRAMTTFDQMTDAFAIQEIEAVLTARGEQP